MKWNWNYLNCWYLHCNCRMKWWATTHIQRSIFLYNYRHNHEGAVNSISTALWKIKFWIGNDIFIPFVVTFRKSFFQFDDAQNINWMLLIMLNSLLQTSSLTISKLFLNKSSFASKKLNSPQYTHLNGQVTTSQILIFNIQNNETNKFLITNAINICLCRL